MKKLTILIVFLFFASIAFKAEAKEGFQLSTHVLDINTGTSPSNVTVELLQQVNNKWTLIDTKKTNNNGRIANLLPGLQNAGTYKLRLHTGEYLASLKQASIYPYIDIIFTIKNGETYHVPVLLSGNGYSTYRGN